MRLRGNKGNLKEIWQRHKLLITLTEMIHHKILSMIQYLMITAILMLIEHHLTSKLSLMMKMTLMTKRVVTFLLKQTLMMTFHQFPSKIESENLWEELV